MRAPVQVGLLTPTGTGAVAVLRIRGDRAVSLVSSFFRPIRGGALTSSQLGGGRIRYGTIVDGDEILDDVIVAAAAGEPVNALDICAHGGVRLLQRILTLCQRHGAEVVALDGVSVQDVWPAGSEIDGEVFAALKEARTEAAAEFLLMQRKVLPAEIERLAAWIRSDGLAAKAELGRLCRRHRTARLLLEGAVVGLVGPTNSGKSTLFNRLVGRDAAIVSPIAGTTRDWVSAEIELRGVPIRLIDTAGRRNDADALERMAMAAGIEAVSRCTVRLLVLDGEEASIPRDWEFTGGWNRPFSVGLLVWNKGDRLSAAQRKACIAAGHETSLPQVVVSALDGRGFEEFSLRLLEHLGFDAVSQAQPCPFTHRQIGLLNESLRLLDSDRLAAEAKIGQVVSSRTAGAAG